ncbi:HDOD domain-containing protein [Variovorax sp. JS1663]|uniref:HDOD domain-containing protein n=1 Tax=Variovorax sp. JS1663 TaxID=1851577 RepID=UPI000B343A74|nr:HDOD domain-containing protein [Variovorax sp. JS1663]OUL98230.1 signal transduction protein [Variovorax sp. JS1663]
MPAAALDQLFAENHTLPTVPKVVRDLIEVLANENASLSQVARKIEADQVLTARMLRLANSPFYGLRRKVATMEEAIRMLGLSAIRTLVISANLTGTFQKVPHVNLPNFWRHSLRVASVARHLAGLGRAVDPNLAFTVGSMHAIGQLIMAIVRPEDIAAVNAASPFDSMRRFAAEEQAFGYHYGDVSARLASRWDFSDEYVTALGGFARPLDMPSLDPLAGLLHLGVWRMALDRDGAAASGAAWPVEVLKALGLPPDSLEDMPAPEELAADLELMIG